eukprot:GAHX01001306.1.p1 GENE.GAHX01001306.1~~GAHX01001306.1.p1  ORF type:complete len:54 (+),score=6.50 GAHX01001306.1:243-404(+)
MFHFEGGTRWITIYTFKPIVLYNVRISNKLLTKQMETQEESLYASINSIRYKI